MAEIRLFKTVSGELAIGQDDAEKKGVKEVAVVQLIPTSSGSVSVALLPFGFPFEEEITGFIPNSAILYEISKIPEDLKNKYTEAKSNIRIAQSGATDGKIIL